MPRWTDFLRQNLAWIVPSVIAAFAFLVALLTLWFGGEGVRTWWNPEKPHLIYTFERISYYKPPPREIPLELLMPHAQDLLADLRPSRGGYLISQKALDDGIKKMTESTRLLSLFGMGDAVPEKEKQPTEKRVTTPVQDRYARPIAEFLKAFLEAGARRGRSDREATFYRLDVRNEGVRAADNVKLTIRQFPIEAFRVLTFEYLDPADVSVERKNGLVRAERIRPIAPKSSLRMFFWPDDGITSPFFLRNPEVSVTYGNGVLAESRKVVRPPLDRDEPLVLEEAETNHWYDKAFRFLVYALALLGAASLVLAWRRSRDKRKEAGS